MNIGLRLHDTLPGNLNERLAIAEGQGFTCAHLAMSKVIPGFKMDDAPSLLTEDLAQEVRDRFAAHHMECAVLGCYLKLAALDGEERKKTQEIYRSDLANQLANIDREAEAYRKKGLDEVSATQWAAASKAKVRQQFENEVASRIDSIWQDSLRNRLDEIEREKKAWQQKGVDEVKATRWAEKAKADARRDAALETLRSQKEELEAFRQGGKIGLLKKLREEAGLTAEDLRFTPAELEKFQAARKEAADNLLPQFAVNPHWEQDVGRQDMANTLAQIRASFQGTPEQLARLDGISITAESADRLVGVISDNMAGAMERLNQSQTMGEGNQTINHAPTVNVSVNIDTAVTQDSESMSRLADQVADRITPAVEQALGSGELAY